MFSIEFMVLYLAEIIMAALVILAASLLIRLVVYIPGLIRKVIKKGVKYHGMRKTDGKVR